MNHHVGDDLSDFYLLNRVIEAGGFTAAARQTGLSRSLLSRRIAELESRLGVQLLQRSTRRFAVTPTGEAVYRHSITLLQAAEAARAVAREMQHENAGLLRLYLPALLEELLTPLLTDFCLSTPRLRLDTHWGHQPPSPDSPCDLSLILHEPEHQRSDTVALPLARIRLVVVGSPGLLERLEPVQRPQRMDERHLLNYGNAHDRQPWRLRQHNPHTTTTQARFSSNSPHALRQAAVAGLGLAQLPLHACQEALAAGLLRTTLEAFEPDPPVLYALIPTGLGFTQAMRSLLHQLRAGLAGRETEGIQVLEENGPSA